MFALEIPTESEIPRLCSLRKHNLKSTTQGYTLQRYCAKHTLAKIKRILQA